MHSGLPIVLAGCLFLVLVGFTRPFFASESNINNLSAVQQADSILHRVHDQVNELRSKHGVKALSWNDHLSTIARDHSQHMAEANYFSHYSPEGLSPTERAQKAGFEYIIELSGGQRVGLGENIFTSYTYHSYKTALKNGEVTVTYNWKSARELADEMIDTWLQSPGHKKNLLREDYTELGMGAFISEEHQLFVTQTFC